MRIGILGGTFDPIHNGHLALAGGVKRRLQLDKLIFMPSYISPHKRTRRLTSSGMRLAMMRLAIRKKAGFSVSRYELNKKGISFTVRTLRALKDRFKKSQLFFLAGADSLTELSAWKDLGKIFKLAVFVVAARPGYKIPKNIHKEIKILKIRTPDISSTDIRNRIRDNKPIAKLVPGAVRKYIVKNKLYK